MAEISQLLAKYKRELEGSFQNGGPHHLDDRDAVGDTLLIYAVHRGAVHEAETLLSAGADINARGEYDFTALHVAAGTADVAMIHALMRYKPNMSAQDHCGQTPIDVANSILNADIREKILRALWGVI